MMEGKEAQKLETAQEVPKKTSAKKWTESAKKVRGLVANMYLRAVTEGKPVAWVMYTMANELFVALDVFPVYPDITRTIRVMAAMRDYNVLNRA